MDSQPQLSPDALREQLRTRFERFCQQIADAVNQAPLGARGNGKECHALMGQAGMSGRRTPPSRDG